MPISLEKIEAIAPDQASLDAARKLLKASSWPTLATDGKDLVWGECQGSGSTPYRVSLQESDAGYKCSCPSRKFPCKHSLALMWLRAEGKQKFEVMEVPAWVQDWLSRRRGPSAAKEGDAAKPKASIAAAKAEAAEPADPKAEERAAAARERNAREREEAILSGLEELDLWLSDQISQGMVHFASRAADACRAMAQRLVDAKASGLATRLDDLPSRLFAIGEGQRPLAAVEELGLLHLIAEAYRRQDELSEGLKADVRMTMGWNQSRDQVLADSGALRVAASWRVVATVRTTQSDRLVRQETWLYRSAGAAEEPRYALLLDFIPAAAAGSRSPYLVGETLNAELTFYPGAFPLRCLIAAQDGPTLASDEALPLPETGLEAAFAEWERRLAERPWLEGWPLAFAGARLAWSGDELYLVGDGLTLPCEADQKNLSALTPLESFGGVGFWDGMRFRLWWAETAWGPWRAS